MRNRLASKLFGNAAAPVTKGRFEVLESIGAGGMGTVYLAYDPKLHRRVALKVLHPDAVGRELDRRRLVREAHALARLSHPNVIQLYELEEVGERVFLAMEYVEGVSLRRWQEQTPRTPTEIFEVYLQASDGLAAAHAAGLVHRDFKPANVLVGNDGRVRVADFGLARATGSTRDDDLPSPGSTSPATADVLTRPGGVPGTPAYMSPEQLRGEEVDARSDQFSFCVALWEALTGQRPFQAHKPDTPAPRPATWPGAKQIEAILRRGLSEDPQDRWRSQLELAGTLRAALAPSTKRPWLWAIGAVGVVGVLWWANAGGSDCPDAEAVTDQVLDAAQLSRIEARLGEVAPSFGEQLWPAIEQRARQHARSLGTAQAQVCTLRSTDASNDQARARCVRRVHASFAAATAMLAEADVEIAGRAVDVLDDLDLATSCLDDAIALRGSDDTDDTSVPVLASIDEARIRGRAGDLERARALAEQAVTSARASARDGLVAAALLARGIVQREAGDVEPAQNDLREAVKLAAADGDPALQAEALLELARLSVLDLEDLDLATERSDYAEGLLLALERPPRLWVRHLNLRGILARERGEHDLAVRHHREAVSIVDAQPREQLGSQIGLLSSWANTLVAAGRSNEASGVYARALSLAHKAYGADHPSVARLELNIGLLSLEELEDPEGALPHLHRAATIQATVYGSGSVRAAASATALARVHFELGQFDEALPWAHAGSEGQEKLPDHHSERISALSLLANLYVAREDWPAAEDAHERLATRLEDVGASTQRLQVLVNLGWIRCDHARCEQAQPLFDEVVAQASDDSELALTARNGLGRVLEAHGDIPRAEATFRAVIDDAARIDAPLQLAAARWQLAQLLSADGRAGAEQRALVRLALRSYEELGVRHDVQRLMHNILDSAQRVEP